jgi:hypothetical protein
MCHQPDEVFDRDRSGRDRTHAFLIEPVSARKIPQNGNIRDLVHASGDASIILPRMMAMKLARSGTAQGCPKAINQSKRVCRHVQRSEQTAKRTFGASLAVRGVLLSGRPTS